MQRCDDYVGVVCVNGYCPKAWTEEHMERDYDIVHSCDECPFYKGCTDCALKDTEYCGGE